MPTEQWGDQIVVRTMRTRVELRINVRLADRLGLTGIAPLALRPGQALERLEEAWGAASQVIPA
jgi:hypothetical protein